MCLREANVSLWERPRLAGTAHWEWVYWVQEFISTSYRGRERTINIIVTLDLQPQG